MSYTALVGFVMMLLITVLLLKKKVSTLFAFTGSFRSSEHS